MSLKLGNLVSEGTCGERGHGHCGNTGRLGAVSVYCMKAQLV